MRKQTADGRSQASELREEQISLYYLKDSKAGSSVFLWCGEAFSFSQGPSLSERQ
jgi:hypothetical protein